MPVRKANAVWEGTLKEGQGKLSLGSGAFEGKYSFGSRFEENPGTNPEELIAAAHAGCFSMALNAALGRAGHQPKRIATTAKVHMEKVGEGFGLTLATALRCIICFRSNRRSVMATIKRNASAQWSGTGKEGKGAITTQSGVLSETPYSFARRFGEEKGTNPEELIAAAHAGCFTMALAFQLQGAGFTPTELATEAVVTLEQEGSGFKISKSALTLTANVPGIDRTKFEELARAAEKNCPVSKVLNATITLNATLE